MDNQQTQSLSFSVEHWTHLYSLQKAIAHRQQASARKLTVQGRLLNQAPLRHKDCEIRLNFLNSDSPPSYPQGADGLYILGELNYSGDKLSANITVATDVFEELRKNLIEYADIDGIHIIVKLELVSPQPVWQTGSDLPIIQLDYAMKGDG